MAVCAATPSDRGGAAAAAAAGGAGGWGLVLACGSHIHLILMCLQEKWTRLEERGNEAAWWSECIKERGPSLPLNEAIFVCTSLRSPPWLRHIQFPCVLPLLVMCGINGEAGGGRGGRNTCKVYRNNNWCQQRGRLRQHLWTCGTACRQLRIFIVDSGPSRVKMSSGKVSLSSSHLPPSIAHHSLSLLPLSPSLTPPRRRFCVCLSPGIPIEDFLRTVARWWPPD